MLEVLRQAGCGEGDIGGVEGDVPRHREHNAICDGNSHALKSLIHKVQDFRALTGHRDRTMEQAWTESPHGA
ncbi:hypothetical protein E2C01_077468 [Portunus trituberculatus]|uniref:Uncharacterized protein n=1 Tax=Portunus trituberculatus TaxID=210409 RepID=A0A5B7IKC3_PORTR|nr:hypothetical protein [Portunus trituberculatus]